MIWMFRDWDQREHGTDGSHNSLLLVAASVAWWLMPIVASIHWFHVRRRGRTIAVSMPVVRAALAVALTALYFTFVHSLAWLSPRLYDAEGKMILVVGTLAAILGAWSQKGAHRRLIRPELEEPLLGITVILAFLPAMFGVLVVFNGLIGFQAHNSLFSKSLPISVHFPSLLGAVMAALLGHAGNLRGAALAMTVGVSVTFLVHMLGNVRYHGGANVPILGCLLAAAVLGLGSVAGTAAPRPLPAKV